MKNDNVLFYSKRCDFCSQIINLIGKIDSFEKYKFVCIDDNDNYPYIQRVPTLIIKEIKKPFIGINAFNWIKSTSQFNRITNNINAKPNQFINSKENPLLYDKKNGPNGMKINSLDNYSFLKKNINNINNISYINSQVDSINTLPEGSKINKMNQKKKLNALMNVREQQDLKILGKDIDMNYSSGKKNRKSYESNIINNRINNINFEKDISLFDHSKINKTNYESNIMNDRIRKINFSVEKQKNLPVITNKNHSGIRTSRIIIDKNNIKKKY